MVQIGEARTGHPELWRAQLRKKPRDFKEKFMRRHASKNIAILMLLFGGTAIGNSCWAQEAKDADADSVSADVAAGHSYHGEAFNEGPRQAAYLMEGLGRSNFSVSTDNPKAQQFFNQGIDQLHGFWYFEAERSFRQVAVLDPDCAMAYWGLAMANVNNEDRASEFIQQATEKSENEDRETTAREKLYIEALSAFYDEEIGDEKKRAEEFTNKLETIVLEHPDDIEAKAFLAVQVWMNNSKKLPITSYVAVNALLDQVFEVDPHHPAHHYRIHLWDRKNAKIALHSAANCGPSLPNVAHMWHMPGHIYSKLKRYEDAVWQQEASARVDHRNMMHDQILPDQIHNFAHNNEWCVRNLNHVGRVQDAIELATNMISMPRHPKYNKIDKRGSAWYGRQRLFDTYSRYELWSELIEACESSVLEPTDKPLEQLKRLRHLGRAHYRSGDQDSGDKVLAELQELLAKFETDKENASTEASDKASEKTNSQKEFALKLAGVVPESLRKDFERKMASQIRRDHKDRSKKATKEAVKEHEDKANVAKRAIDELLGYQLVEQGKFKDAAEKFKKAGEVDAIYRASVLLKAEDADVEDAIKKARDFVEGHEGEVQPQANLCHLLWQAEMKDEAKEEFEKLQQISGSIDMSSPVFERLADVAKYAGVEGDWRITSELAKDLGQRPELDSLGPFRWQPVGAKEWQLTDSQQQTIAMKQYQGKPVIVIFYLGHGCLHCAEQLQKFAPMLDEYEAAGIEMVAISSDDREGLKQSIDSYGDQPLPIQLLANPELDVFKSWRVYDEFEKQPLHGTFLIDGDGKIRWQDISYEPFMEPEFLLKESLRLLSQ